MHPNGATRRKDEERAIRAQGEKAQIFARKIRASRRVHNYPPGDTVAVQGGWCKISHVTGKSVHRERLVGAPGEGNDASSTVNPIYFVPGKGGESETRKPFSGWAPNGDATGDL